MWLLSRRYRWRNIWLWRYRTHKRRNRWFL